MSEFDEKFNQHIEEIKNIFTVSQAMAKNELTTTLENQQLETELSKLKVVANKVVLCFPKTIPKGQETVEFNIPAYIIKELKEVL